MEILLIGNGFDLAHGLPTKYRDFLDFCQGIEIMFSEDFASLEDYEEKLKETLRTDVSPQVFSQLMSAFYDKNSINMLFTIEQMEENMQQRSVLRELHTLINQNTWIKYFMQRSSYIGGNWIDFELEISSVIKALDGYDLNSYMASSRSKLYDPAREIIDIAIDIAMWSLNKVFLGEVTDSFIDFLNEELMKLIRALEIYISAFINCSTIKQKNSNIAQLHPDHVLSFNYSDIYERTYGGLESIAFDYIHGKADLENNKDNCNLVLGIDEYLDDNRKNTDLRFLAFKKFYQRIYKSTDSQYWKWLTIIEATHEPSTLYVFGHSLDVTDRDVLQAFLLCPYMKTKIFYYRESEDDKQTLGKLIHNLLLLLGQEELIQRTSSGNIEFIPQAITP